MGRKRFIDKKKAATFQILARDSSDPSYGTCTENDRVFVRVDNNPVSFPGFEESHEYSSSFSGFADDPNLVFADAPDDDGDAEGHTGHSVGKSSLPDHVRKEILELGFPDDGYNYLFHLREIKKSGGGAAYYENPKAKPDEVPLDVKAYDASRLLITEADADVDEKIMYSVAEKTVNVKVQKAADPEVVALLNDKDSQFDSDVEDLEEDFVFQANLPEAGEDAVEHISLNARDKDKKVSCSSHLVDVGNHANLKEASTDNMQRSWRLLDEKFDMLELQEYGEDSDDGYGDIVGVVDEHSMVGRLDNTLKNSEIDDLHLDDNYKVPADLLRGDEMSKDGELLKTAAQVLRRCAEYAEKYEDTDKDDHNVIIMEESSDDSEAWDCETIISTYSNLDNHPGRIGGPERLRKTKLAETVSGALKSDSKHVISLRGKDKLPVDYLPGRKATTEKVKLVEKSEQQKRKSHGQESKEEKKERKAAVKGERREARRMKKEVKELYRCEAQRAQKVAAISGPSSIHLM